MSDDDMRRTREANALLNRLASVQPYARLVHVLSELETVVNRGASPKRTASDMNRAARALGIAAGTFVDEIRERALKDLGVGDHVDAVQQAIAEECGRPEFRLLAALGELSKGPFIPLEDGVGIDTDAVAELGKITPDLTMQSDLVASVRAGVAVAQRLIGRQLEIYRERIDEASRWLRRLAAEVPDGAPMLMRADQLDPRTEKIEIGQATFESLALDSAVYLHRALRRARQLLALSPGRDPERPESGDDQRPFEVPTEHAANGDRNDGNESGVTSVSASEVVSVEPSAAGIAGAEAVTEMPSGGREDQVVDLRSLAAHVTEFTDELERAWSHGLDAEALTGAHSEMRARFTSLLSSIERRLHAAERTLRASGIDPIVATFPMTAEAVAELNLVPDSDQRWRQLQHAEIEAMQSLLEVFKGISSPSARRIDLLTGESESWWEAGAFELLRSRVRLLVRVSEAAAGAEARAMQRELPGEGKGTLLDRLRLAGDALAHGDPEGALIHGLVALHLRVALDAREAPDDLLERLGSDARLEGEAPLLRLLSKAAATLSRGQELDIGAAVLLAPRVLQLIANLCLERPEILRDALGDANRDA
ncbi:MAG: hypothetical protein WD942_09780 [Dehalococcoidia bacterium]